VPSRRRLASSGNRFVREVDGAAVSRWYEDLTAVRDLWPGTAVRHFNVMHHMMEKASTIWSKETGIDRNPADRVEVNRPDDARDRYLSEDELVRLKLALDEKRYRKGTRAINKTFHRLRLIVLIALTTGMRVSEIFGLRWSDVMYGEGLIAVRAKLKGGKMRYAQMPVELAAELRQFPVVIGEDRVFPPKPGATSGRPLRTRENPRPLEYQDDRTLCEAGAAAYCADQQHGAGNVETDGATKMRQGERRLADVRVLFARQKPFVFGCR
jgi:integrase